MICITGQFGLDWLALVTVAGGDRETEAHQVSRDEQLTIELATKRNA